MRSLEKLLAPKKSCTVADPLGKQQKGDLGSAAPLLNSQCSYTCTDVSPRSVILLLLCHHVFKAYGLSSLHLAGFLLCHFFPICKKERSGVWGSYMLQRQQKCL